MKYLSKLRLILLMLLLLINFTGYVGASSNLEPGTSEFMLQNTNMGTRFFVAVPQNDIKSGQAEEVLAFYICSYTDTRVKFFHIGQNIVKYRDVKAFKPLVISSKNGDATFNWEVTESEVPIANGIEITADDPIAVYVLNSRNASADGYVAIPTESWGKKYIHCAYYDHRELNMRRGGGFIILSSHDGTNVTIQLKGTGAEFGQTVGRKKIGQTITTTLKEGEVYMVRGDGNTDQGFDLTGSEITANYPIGVISFHQRTMIPNECPNGRDHLSEMLLPVNTWGTDFITLAFPRGNLGDLIRVVASEDDTRVQGTSYQTGTGNVLEYFDRTLDAGEFFEHRNTICKNNNTQTGVRGITVWKTTKPAMVMQYAYSFPWDNDNRWDPLMVLIPPITQFKKSVVFEPAVESDFVQNQITFFAVGNPNDPEKKLLKSVMLDGEEISKSSTMFLYSQVPSTNIYYGRADISQETHNITSETEISGYITGFSGFTSYAWPFIMGTDKNDQLDTLPPEIIFEEEECGNYTINVFEQRNSYKDPNPQTDQGIRRIILFKETSYNYNLELYKPNLFIPEFGIYEQKFFLNLIDPKADAKAYFGVVDRAGNFSVDSLYYDAPNLNSNFSQVHFGNIRQNTKSQMEFIITNTEIDSLVINNISLKKNECFNIIKINPAPLPLQLNSMESATITIEFEPPVEFTYDDSLLIESDCYKTGYEITGTGVLPKVTIEDWFAGSIEAGKKICYDDVYGQGMRIMNPGTDTLIISSFEGITLPFSLSDPCEPPLPIKIAPNELIYLETVCFNPTDTGSFRSDVVIKCNAGNEDTISIWRGIAYTKVFVENNNGNNEFNFMIVPNPSTEGKVTLQFNIKINSNVIINIYDNNGKQIEEILNRDLISGNHKIEYLTHHLSSGIYYILLEQNNKRIMKKIVVSH